MIKVKNNFDIIETLEDTDTNEFFYILDELTLLRIANIYNHTPPAHTKKSNRVLKTFINGYNE